MLSIASTNEQMVTVIAAPKTASGRPAAVDGPIRVSKQSGDATFTQDPTKPLEFKAVSADAPTAPGTTIFLVEADADLGAGEVLIQDTVEYAVSGVQAASFGLSAGAVEDKP